VAAVRPLLGPVAVFPWAELGIGDTRIPTGQARWNVSRWDIEPARWASTEPTWLDVSCEVNSAESDTGRTRVVERFRPGAADIVLRNLDGWADLEPPPAPPAALAVRPGRQVRYGVDTPTGRHVLFRGYIDEAVPLYVPYGTDVVQCNCIDALGEAGRAALDPLDVAVAAETVTARIGRILDARSWPPGYRDLNASTVTLQPSTLGGAVVDLLGQAADSAGGAVFGTLAGAVAYRARDWQVYMPGTPPDATVGNVGPGDICPSTWELSFRRRDVTTVARMGRSADDHVTLEDSAGRAVVGFEPFTRSDLIPVDDQMLTVLAARTLAVRAVSTMPRIEAVTLDAATDPGDGRLVELMATARPETPTRIRCRLRARDGRAVFDVEMFVTGVRHTITDRGRWWCRLTLDPAAPFAAAGGRWDYSGWDRSLWSAAPALYAEARALVAELIGTPS